MTSNYTVMAVTLVVWIGIFVYLLMLDQKTRRLEGKK
jgi:CcmD family protein